MSHSGESELPLLFVSYSRREFGAAETMAEVARREGDVDPWMDADRLRPGDDWASEIGEAIDRADALVLLASAAAFGSEYVRGEVKRARDQGIPVHIVVVGAGTVPECLRGNEMYDGRTDLRAAILQVCAAIRRDPLPDQPRRPSGREFGTRWPVAVSRFMSLLGVAAIALIAAAAIDAVKYGLLVAETSHYLSPRPSVVDQTTRYLTNSLFLLMGAVPLVLAAFRFPRRRASGTVLMGCLIVDLIAVLWALLDLAAERRHLAPFHATGYYLALLLIAFLALAAATAALRRSTLLYAWVLTGTGHTHARRKLLGPGALVKTRRMSARPAFLSQWPHYRARLKQLPDLPELVTFAVRHDPTDRAIAEMVSSACDDAGMVHDSQHTAHWVFLIVSSATRWEELRGELRQLGGRGIIVLAANLPLPADQADIRSHQWLDFRKQEADGMESHGPPSHNDLQRPPHPGRIENEIVPVGPRMIFGLCPSLPVRT